MAKYQAYPEYKDSGVDSVGVIPHQWSALKLKYIFDIKKRIAGKIGYDVLSVTQKGIKIKDIDSGEGQLSMDYSKYQRVYPGEFAMNHMDLLTGYVDISNYDGVTSPDYRVFFVRDKHNLYSRYYLYLLQDGYKQRRFFHLGQGSAHLGRWRLPTEAFNEIRYPCPSFEEQTQIATFLDHETAKIDNLIEKQQQLIELLKEKRQAVISHAVTKGLNPDVPMKDSGVEWLGEVPEHWDVCLLKFKCSSITDGAHISPDTNGGTHYFVSIKDIKNGVIDFDNALLTTTKSYFYLIKTGCMPLPGDILFSKDGTIGQTAITPSNIDFVVASSLVIIRPNRLHVLPEFLDFLLQSSFVKEQVESFVKGAALRRLSIQNLQKIFGIFPSLEEQNSISNFISNKLVMFDVLENQATFQIGFLQERRTALISAAVTGKIDVRNWVAPEAREAEVSQEATA
ncbi:restriction endonuclease subunit S [Serratia proteamaculans]|uniref:restriction endonuclease subunit S n=1 Tax=Serratia proteamaculans TaxID=28151 RepID=UPI0039B0EAA5